MAIDHSIAVTKQIFNNNLDPRRLDAEILQLLKIALMRNNIEFAGRRFMQACGTEMVKRFVPWLANIYMRKFDELPMIGSHGKPENYFHFLENFFRLARYSPAAQVLQIIHEKSCTWYQRYSKSQASMRRMV